MTLSTDTAGVSADKFDDLRALMEEPPGGPGHGRRRKDAADLHGDDLRVELGVVESQRIDFLKAGGWGAVDPGHGNNRRASYSGSAAGMVTHRGVLHPAEYVDPEALRLAIEAELGFTLSDLHEVYSTGGRIPFTLHGLRGRIDARLLELANAGANMDALARITGVTARTMDRALVRARRTEAVAA